MRNIYYSAEFPIFQACKLWNGNYYSLNGHLYLRTYKFGEIVFIKIY